MFRCPELNDLNLSTGLYLIRSKLPVGIQSKWAQFGQSYEEAHFAHPPFTVFKEFLRKQAKLRSNNHFEIITHEHSNSLPEHKGSKSTLNTHHRSTKTTQPLKTEIMTANDESRNEPSFCHYHNSNRHNLTSCEDFRNLPFNERKELLYSFWLCKRCLRYHPGSDNCNIEIQCEICMLKGHLAAMHIDKQYEQSFRCHKKPPNDGDTDNAGEVLSE